MVSVAVGEVYELDGINYRCLELKPSGIGWFQPLNPDGTDRVYYVGTLRLDKQIIFNRIKELKLIEFF